MTNPSAPTFLGTPADSTDRIWDEDTIQMFIVSQLRRADYFVVASLEGLNIKSHKTRAKYKALGRTAGEPDLRIYLPKGRVIFIELKTAIGTLSKAQKEHHLKLVNHDFDVLTVKARTPWHGWCLVRDAVEAIKEGKNAPPME